jgi:hypothetical protein
MPLKPFSISKKQLPSLLKKYFKYTALVCLIGVIPLIMYWANNLGQVRPEIVLKPLLVIILCIWTIFQLLLLIMRSLPKAALLMTLFVFIFFTYGHLVQLIPAGSPITGIQVFILYILVLMVGSFAIFRAKHISGNIFVYILLVAGFLLIFNLFRIIRFDPRISKGTGAAPITVQNKLQTDPLPDVYYIVLDAYARDDILQQVYGYDNSAFLQALRDRGFYIPDCAWSNYDQTHLTIPSVLNMNYLDNMGVPDKTLSLVTETQINLTLNNQARNTFASLGYQFVSARGWGSFNDIMNSDIYLNYFSSVGQKDTLAEHFFDYLFLQTTLIRATDEFARINANPSTSAANTQVIQADKTSLGYQESDFWYHQTVYELYSLEKLPAKPGNYFVYAHIMVPHGPYVFNRDGSFRYAPDLTNEKSYYIDSIVYINQRVLELVDALIKNSDTPPVIIIQADHGTHYFINGINKHKILSAYYLPGKVDITPYATITPVNDLRLVLHDYFDPSVKLLPDTLFVMESNGYQPEAAYCGLQK